MVTQQESAKPAGLRGRVAELCYSTGALRPLQRVRSWLHRDLRILAYHRVMPLPDSARYDYDLELISTTPEQFRAQMLHIKQHFRPMRLTDVAATLDAGGTLPPDAVAVTFDDGYDDNYRNAFPILRELGIPATFFVSTGHIDTGVPFGYDWLVHMILLAPVSQLQLPELDIDLPLPDDREGRRAIAGHVLLTMKNIDAIAQEAMIARLERAWQMPSIDARPPECRPMSWDQLREMQAAGLEIGSHGVHHRMLAKMERSRMRSEVRESREALERELQPESLLMSYPVGGDRAFDQPVMDATCEEGFDLAVCYVCGTNPQPASNRFALQRLPVERMMSSGWFAAMLALPNLVSYPTVKREPAHEQAEA